MEAYKIEANNYNKTLEIASKLANYLKPGSVLTLEGELGAGKTSFTQGLAQGLGITKIVNSPTFTIIKEYQGRLPLYHMDVYRLIDSIEDLGFDEYFYGEGVTVIEWASVIEEFLPNEYLKIIIDKLENDKRVISFQPIGKEYLEVCKEFFQNENFSN